MADDNVQRRAATNTVRKYTPGPWKAPIDPDHGKVVTIRGERTEQGFVGVASMHWGRPAEEVNANGFLIRAAPELLQVLADALGWYQRDIYDGATDAGPDPEWVDEARRALAYALGANGDARSEHEAVQALIREVHDGC